MFDRKKMARKGGWAAVIVAAATGIANVIAVIAEEQGIQLSETQQHWLVGILVTSLSSSLEMLRNWWKHRDKSDTNT